MRLWEGLLFYKHRNFQDETSSQNPLRHQWKSELWISEMELWGDKGSFQDLPCQVFPLKLDLLTSLPLVRLGTQFPRVLRSKMKPKRGSGSTSSEKYKTTNTSSKKIKWERWWLKEQLAERKLIFQKKAFKINKDLIFLLYKYMTIK